MRSETPSVAMKYQIIDTDGYVMAECQTRLDADRICLLLNFESRAVTKSARYQVVSKN